MLGHVEDAADVEGSVSLVVQDVAGLVVSLSYEAVKLLVLPLTDVLGVQHPQSLWRSRRGVPISSVASRMPEQGNRTFQTDSSAQPGTK